MVHVRVSSKISATVDGIRTCALEDVDNTVGPLVHDIICYDADSYVLLDNFGEDRHSYVLVGESEHANLQFLLRFVNEVDDLLLICTRREKYHLTIHRISMPIS